MYHFRRIQSPGSISAGFNVTFKFDQNLLQNVSWQIKANTLFENGCTECFSSSFSVGCLDSQLVFTNFKELGFSLESVVFLQEKLKQMQLTKCDTINSCKSFQVFMYVLIASWY